MGRLSLCKKEEVRNHLQVFAPPKIRLWCLKAKESHSKWILGRSARDRIITSRTSSCPSQIIIYANHLLEIALAQSTTWLSAQWDQVLQTRKTQLPYQITRLREKTRLWKPSHLVWLAWSKRQRTLKIRAGCLVLDSGADSVLSHPQIETNIKALVLILLGFRPESKMIISNYNRSKR